MLSNAALCQNCMLKFNEYDELMTKATQLKEELINQIKSASAQSSMKIESYGETFQLTEDFPEIEFDFKLKNDEKFPEIAKNKKVQKDDEVSDDFAKVLEKEEMKYDIEVFQRALRDDKIAQTESKTKKSSNVKKSSKETSAENLSCSFAGCNKSFASKVSLRAHFICHNKEFKSFVCEKCGKRFFYKLSFTQHLKIHSGVRDKECETCGFKAISSTHLQRHIRARHTKEKNHVCTFCNRAFSERYNMMSHMRKQHIEKQSASTKASETFYKCSICCMEYSDDFKLKQHLELSHNVLAASSEDFVV